MLSISWTSLISLMNVSFHLKVIASISEVTEGFSIGKSDRKVCC